MLDSLLVASSLTTGVAYTIDYFIGLKSPPVSFAYLRALRVLRLARKLRSVRMLLLTLVFSAPAMANITMLLYIIIYVFSMFGMTLLGGALWGSYCGISQHANFDQIYLAVLTLFRIATGDSWSCYYMDALKLEYRDNYVVPSTIWVRLFFVIYVMLILVVVSVFNAILLQYYSVQSSLRVNDKDIEDFSKAWADFDPGRTHFIPVENVGKLVLRLKPPLASITTTLSDGRTASLPIQAADLASFITNEEHPISVPVRKRKVHYIELLVALVNAQVGQRMFGQAVLVQTKLTQRWPRMVPSLLSLRQEAAENLVDLADYVQEHAREHANHQSDEESLEI